MKELKYHQKKKYANLRKELAKEGFGTSLDESAGRDHLRLSRVNIDGIEIHKAFRIEDDFKTLETYRQVSACINFYNNN